jgi:hypothetical protein
MQKEEIEKIAAKYRRLAGSIESYDEEKANNYMRFADFIEENNDVEDDDDDTEEELFDKFNEAEAEYDAQWDSMFPDGDDDDSITDFLTKE